MTTPNRHAWGAASRIHAAAGRQPAPSPNSSCQHPWQAPRLRLTLILTHWPPQVRTCVW